MSATNPGKPPKSSLIVVAAALVDRDGRLLVQQRPEGLSMAGLWEFPGGKIEPGETPEQALERARYGTLIETYAPSRDAGSDTIMSASHPSRRRFGRAR